MNFKIREYGFYDAMEYYSLPVQKEFIVSVDPAFDKSINDFRIFLGNSSALPSALFCMNDMMAYGCIKALQKNNYNIPLDVSVVGFDDLPSSVMSDPPLTTIRVSSHQIGRRAVERLSERISNPNEGLPENIMVPNKLVIRQSVRQT
jgi:LacI family transcriptional regulator